MWVRSQFRGGYCIALHRKNKWFGKRWGGKAFEVKWNQQSFFEIVLYLQDHILRPKVSRNFASEFRKSRIMPMVFNQWFNQWKVKICSFFFSPLTTEQRPWWLVVLRGYFICQHIIHILQKVREQKDNLLEIILSRLGVKYHCFSRPRCSFCQAELCA